MQAEWEPVELIGAWTLTGSDWDLIANKAGVTRLGFAVMLKFYEIGGQFPAYPEEVPPAAVSYLGSLVRVDPALFAERYLDRPVDQVPQVPDPQGAGTRPPTEADEDRWAQWLADEMCPAETNRDRLADALRRRCRSEKVEPRHGQVERVVASGCRRFDDAFAATAAGRLGPMVRGLRGPAVTAGRAGGAQVRPGAAGAGHAAGRDRQAVDGAGARADRGGARWRLGPDRGGVAGARRAAACTHQGFRGPPRSRCGMRCWRRCAGPGRPSWSTAWRSC